MNSLLELADDASRPVEERTRQAIAVIDGATRPVRQAARR
jgi:hypothetical protein